MHPVFTAWCKMSYVLVISYWRGPDGYIGSGNVTISKSESFQRKPPKIYKYESYLGCECIVLYTYFDYVYIST
jgi:hypothetical protein